jgi:drug/metabolite transporter (DMT)-like permease
MILASLCIGTIGVLVKLIGPDIPIMTINFFRIFIGLIFLLITVPFIDKTWYKVKKKDLPEYIFIGFLFAASLSIYNTAMTLAPIQNVVLLNAIYPFIVFVSACAILKEKITKTKLFTLGIAIIGIAIMNPFQTGNYLIGNILALISALFYGLQITFMRKSEKSHTIGSVVWFLIFASIFLLPFPFIYGLGTFSISWLYLLVLGIISTGFAYLVYNLALKKIEAETAATTAIILATITAITLAVIIIKETLDIKTILGGSLLIVAAIYLLTHQKKTK